MDIEPATTQQEEPKLQLEDTQMTLQQPVMISDNANSNTSIVIAQASKSIKKKKTKKKLRALQAYKPTFAMIEEQLVFLLKGNILLELNRNSDDQDYVPIGFKLNPQNRWNPIQRVIEHTKHQCIEIQVDNALKPIEDFKFIIKVLCSYGDSQYHDIALSLEKYQAIIESTKQIEQQQGEYIKGMQQKQLQLQQQQQQSSQESSQDQFQLFEKPNEPRETTPNNSLLFHSYSQNDLNLSEMLFSPSENSQGIQQTLGYLFGNESFRDHAEFFQNTDNDLGQFNPELVFFEQDEHHSNGINSSQMSRQHREQNSQQQYSTPQSINNGNLNNRNTPSYENPQQQQPINNSANASYYNQFLDNQSKNTSNINGRTAPLLSNKPSKPSPTIEEYEKAFYDQFYLRAMDVLGSMNKGKEQLFFAFTMGKFDKFGFFDSMYNFGVNKNFMILLGSEMNSMSNVFMRNGWLEIFDHQTRISNSLNFITLINREYEQHMSQMKNNASAFMKNDNNMNGNSTNAPSDSKSKSNFQARNDPLQEHFSESVDIVVNTFDQIKIPAKLSIHDIKVQQFGLRITQIDISPTMIQQVHAIRQKQLASQSHPNYIQMFDRTLTYTQESQSFLEKFYPQKKTNKNQKDINEPPEVRESIEEMRCGFRKLLSM